MTQPDAFDFAREAAWEVRSVERAVARYREAAQTRAAHELPPGRRAMVETVLPVSAEIERRQRELATAGAGKRGLWEAPFLAFEPDALAVVAVSTALRCGVEHESRMGQTITTFARRVGSTLRDQADHDAWTAAQEQAQRAAVKAAKADGKDPAKVREDSLLRRFRRLHPEADRRAWGRFAARIEGARSAKWDDGVRTEIGGALADCLAKGAPTWFEVARVGPGPEVRKPACLLLTTEAVEKMAEVDVRAEVARPMLLPMIIPPNPWRYTVKDAA